MLRKGVAVEITHIQTKAKQKEYDEVTNKVSNSQLQKEPSIGDGQRKKKVEEPKHTDRSLVVKRTKQCQITMKIKQKRIMLCRNSKTLV